MTNQPKKLQIFDDLYLKNEHTDEMKKSTVLIPGMIMSGHLVFGFFTGEKKSHQLFKQHLLNIWKKPAFHSRLTI